MPPKRNPNTNNNNNNKGQNKKGNANKHYDADPSFEQVIQLAVECGYKEYRPTISATLYFVETKPTPGKKPIKINVYPTTRSIMTHLDHPKAGVNSLWRSNAYDDLAELRELFMNPRAHTDKGYRNKGKAVRGCVQCGEMKARTEYTNNQWSKGPDVNRCRACVDAGPAAAPAAEESKVEDGASPTVLIEGLDKLGISDDGNVSLRDEMERRQFNCPECPQNGRGEYIFFKRVPVHKPIVKCPQCKLANNGNCKRLYPVPKDEERGYGLYRCSICNDKWGSKRGVANLGQECGKCLSEGRPDVMVKPFRMGPIFHGRGGGGRGDGGGRGGGGRGRGGGRGNRRVPKDTVPEDSEVQAEYTPSDRQRSDNFAKNNSFVPTPDQTRSYDFQPVEAPSAPAVPPGLAPIEATPPPAAATAPVQPNSKAPKGYHHKCEGCAKGLCRRRRMPKSKIHTISDGDTVSTRGSIATNSEVDRSEFEDRDAGFGFEDD